MVFIALTALGQIGFKGVNVINSTNRFLSFGEGGVSIVGVQGGTFISSGGTATNALLNEDTIQTLKNEDGTVLLAEP